MDISHIAPIPSLGLTLGCKCHLMLPHLLRPETHGERACQQYMKFMVEERFRNKYLIMDNGADEFGASVPFEQLWNAARALGAHEVVLPDVQHDAEATITATQQACAWLLTTAGRTAFAQLDRPRLMIVPQGRSYAEWTWALDALWHMVNHTTAILDGLPPVVGIAKNYGDVIGTHRLLSYVPPGYDIHLLGSPKRVEVLRECVRDFRIRSMDTARAMVFAQLGREWGSIYPGRPERYFTEPIEDSNLATVNMLYIEDIANA